jgi:hypothetical protein
MSGPNVTDQLGFLEESNRVLAGTPATDEPSGTVLRYFHYQKVDSSGHCGIARLGPHMREPIVRLARSSQVNRCAGLFDLWLA